MLDTGAIIGICTAVATLISALAGLIWKIKKSPKTWKQLISDVLNNKSKEAQEFASVAKESLKTVKDLSKKLIDTDTKKLTDTGKNQDEREE